MRRKCISTSKRIYQQNVRANILQYMRETDQKSTVHACNRQKIMRVQQTKTPQHWQGVITQTLLLLGNRVFVCVCVFGFITRVGPCLFAHTISFCFSPSFACSLSRSLPPSTSPSLCRSRSLGFLCRVQPWRYESALFIICNVYV